MNCPRCARSIIEVPPSVPDWIDRRVRHCPDCGLGIAEAPEDGPGSPRQLEQTLRILLRLFLVPTTLLVFTLIAMGAVRIILGEFERSLGTTPPLLGFGLTFTVGIAGTVLAVAISRHASARSAIIGWSVISSFGGLILLLVWIAEESVSPASLPDVFEFAAGLGLTNLVATVLSAPPAVWIRHRILPPEFTIRREPHLD